MLYVYLYKNSPTLNFADPQTIVLYKNQTQAGYKSLYVASLTPSKIWSGAGKTYNIGLNEVCDLPSGVFRGLGDDKPPVYLRLENTDYGTDDKFYYITRVQEAAGYVRLFLELDAFATYYNKIQFNDFQPLIVRRTTNFELAEGKKKLLLLPDEATPPATAAKKTLNTFYAYESGMISGATIGFIFKVKYLQAKTLSTESYTTLLFYMPLTPNAGVSKKHYIQTALNKIHNTYEIEGISAIGTATGLACQITDMYLVPNMWIKTNSAPPASFNFITPNGQKSSYNAYIVYGLETLFTTTTLTQYAAGGKLKIGNNELNVPPYRKMSVKLILEYNISDFDILIKIENNQPQSIKKYFQCEILNSTQETSLQALSRYIGYANTFKSAAGSAGLSMTAGGIGALGAASALGGAAQSIQSDILQHATKEALPATAFENAGISVFLDEENDKIIQEFINFEYFDSGTAGVYLQGYNNLLEYGFETYEVFDSLQAVPIYSTYYGAHRNYYEIETHITGIPRDMAALIEAQLKTGVTIKYG